MPDRILSERIMVLDGAMGTMLQRYGLRKGECPEEVVLSRPEVIRSIHREYLEAGADIITTDTFNATAVSLKEYGLSGRVREIARRAAELARGEADRFDGRFVAGSVGPTLKSASIATDIEDMSRRAVTFDELSCAYAEEIRGLSEGGADLLILETFFDALNAKAAIYAADTVFGETGRRLPMIISATLMSSGRLLSGQTPEAYFTSVAHARPLAISLNCSFGGAAMLPYVRRMSEAFPQFRTCAYPNAGLPNGSGGYDQTPEEFAAGVEEFLRMGCVNIVGGCCGTTPDHIRAVARVAKGYSPRKIIQPYGNMALSGLETFTPDSAAALARMAEEGSVASDPSFMECAKSGDWDGAVWSIHDMVDAGAGAVNVCVDSLADPLPEAMSHLLKLMGADPVVAAVPVVITSSRTDVIEAGLKVVPGRPAVACTCPQAAPQAERLAERYGALFLA